MIFRLFVEMPQEGWVLVCTVDSPTPAEGVRVAKRLLKPEHRGRKLQFVTGNLPDVDATRPLPRDCGQPR
jgi:hypothetical protein